MRLWGEAYSNSAKGLATTDALVRPVRAHLPSWLL